MSVKKSFPVHCPSCNEPLAVTALECSQCDTKILGHYVVPPFMRLCEEQQRFVMEFVLSSGSLKEMASKMGLSYPTVRNLLDEIIENLKNFEKDE